jgi:hypothetical protein
MLRFMNFGHAPLTNWGLSLVAFRPAMTILDIGCGGGATLKRLLKRSDGVWKFMFNNGQYRLGGRCLLRIFPNKPRTTRQQQIDNSRIFLELDYINNVRNRIAHHEPICFGHPICIDTTYALNNYARMMKLFQWMGLDSGALLYGLDNVGKICGKIMCI